MSEPHPSGDVATLTEHLFRHEAGKLVSVLTGIFGIARLQMAEDVVQEALVRALQTWPFYGVPKNPAAWLTQTAKHLALDLIRRETRFREKEPEVIATIEQTLSGEAESPRFEHELKDGRLRLMFACCHPLIPQEAQTALALKTLCGFSPGEIAQAFLTNEATIAKRLTRARQKIRDAAIPFEIPVGDELSVRLESVLQTLYLLFNEGYKASSGDTLIREELCQEAIRLASHLAAHPQGDRPAVHALLALMLLNAARLPARVDSEGNLFLLNEQDRARWDRALIARGLQHLEKSAMGEDLSEYHIQAGIAACHAMAESVAATDWPRILALYDRWMESSDSAVVALNRAVAVTHVHGPDAGLAAIRAIRNCEPLLAYYLYYAVQAELETRRENFAAAAPLWRNALDLTALKSERTFLARRLQECAGRVDGAALPPAGANEKASRD